MDSDLKAFFLDNQAFIRVAVGGVEERLTKRLDKFEATVGAGFRAIDNRLAGDDQRLDAIDKRLATHDQRFDAINKRLTTHDQRFDAIDKHLATHDQRFDAIEDDLADIKGSLRALLARSGAKAAKRRRSRD